MTATATATLAAAVSATATVCALVFGAPASAQSSQLAPVLQGSSAEREESSENSSTVDASSNEFSAGSSLLTGPLFTPLSSASGSSADSTNSAGSASSEDLSSMDEDFIVGSDIDLGPEPKLLDIEKIEDGKEGSAGNYYEIKVWSPANKGIIRNSLILPEGGLDNTTPRPTVYLFAGAHGGNMGVNWHTETDFEDYFADKNVNVVGLLGGTASMFADWHNDDPVAGRNQWVTYMGEELPQVMEENFYDNGIDAIAGCSMGGAAALNVAKHYPERFKAAGSLSGYPAQSGILGRAMVKGIINDADSSNLWGNLFDPAWQDNDPTWDPSAFGDTKLFVGTGWGLPTANEAAGDWTWGWFLETVSQYSSNYFYRKAQLAGLDVTRYQTVFGSHSYVNFEQELYAAWDQVFAEALDVA
ncbi:alpha/beta hydrolase family protein [uncultured Corynebacterium sp.]|uniref:alpha/beta hydrolase n=1 Tax=uncultured Corynebacterium sp. TaxID=159447 RepID=UPI0025E373F9|nr:alpha/beta hydrolase family protein [uncultured Corynebacterium sp.]